MSLQPLLQRTGGFFVGVAIFASTATAQIKLDRFYPPAVGVGETTVSAEGKFPDWPCQVRCDRDDVQIKPADESGKLTVTIANTCAPGVAWIRLLDKQSASDLVPLLIEQVAVTEEKESNNHLSAANPIELPAVIAGRLQTGGDVDTFAVSLIAGDTFVAAVIANQVLRSPMDAVLQIVDTSGNVLAQSDDVHGLDPLLVYQPVADAEVAVRIFAFPSTPNSTIGFAGAGTFQYDLRMTAGPFLDHVSPIVMGATDVASSAAGWNLPSDGGLKLREATKLSPPVWYPAKGLGWNWRYSIDRDATHIAESPKVETPAIAETLPVVFTGGISAAKQVDRFRFQVAAGKKYVARSHSKSAGFLLDSVLRIIDVKGGNEIVRKDDVSRTNFDTVAEFKAKSDGQYELQVSDAVDAFGLRHQYGVWLGEATPRVRLSVAADHFTLPAGGSLEIPVTVTRTEAFAEKIRITVTGAPEGVTVSDAVSEAKGETAKSVKLKLTAVDSATFQGNIRVEGTSVDANDKPVGDKQVASFALRTGIDLTEIWLTVSPKK